jgi:hypothetical protein
MLLDVTFSNQGLPEVNEYLFIHPKPQCLHIVNTIITAISHWDWGRNSAQKKHSRKITASILNPFPNHPKLQTVVDFYYWKMTIKHQ